MRLPALARFAGGLAMAVLAGIVAARAIESIGGTAPSYGPATLAEVPNAAAIVRRFWSPGLDAGFNPQGLDIASGTLFVSAYRSERSDQHRGPCRLFRLDARNGALLGQADVPSPCGHAGGVAAAQDGTVFVADTHDLFRAMSVTSPFRRIGLGPGLVGALAASTPDAVWLGSYKENEQGRLYGFDVYRLVAFKEDAILSVADSHIQLPIPSYAQGAAFDGAGRLWIARSDTRWGELVRLNPVTGAVEKRFATVPGIEGLAFGVDGLLWAVSEAGARHSYDNWWAPYVLPFYPLVFALDPRRLE